MNAVSIAVALAYLLAAAGFVVAQIGRAHV